MINYDLALNIINIIAYSLFFLMLVFGWYYIASFVVSCKKVKPVPHSDKLTKFGIIIAARNESKVIKHLLNSLCHQTYNKDFMDVWIIIEDKNDPTVLIAQEYGYNVFCRDSVAPGRHTKGCAIQELYNFFKENNIVHDAYLIFDADNIASRNYVEIMNDLRQSGVQCGLGYRNFTNANKNWMTCTSATFFTYMMSFTARMRTNLFEKSTLCGTGFFIDKQVIDDAGGWIFTGMTEDTELTNYSYYHDVKMRYYPLAEFFDEQCETIKSSHNQKVRWIWGYFSSKKAFRKESVDYHSTTNKQRFWAKFEYNVSIYPFVVFSVLNFLLFIIALLLSGISAAFRPEYTAELFGKAMIQFAILYGTYVLIASVVIIKDQKHLKFSVPMIIVTILTFFLFYGDILLGVLDGLFNKKKRRIWEPTEHSGTVIDERAKSNE